MNLTLLITNHCNACERAKSQLENLQAFKPDIKLNIMHINSYKDKRIFITPALLVNGELFSYGDIDTEKIIAKLK
jgi:alkyl hydroperoxide reductase subunit AhpF